jgi:hypothetical protein
MNTTVSVVVIAVLAWVGYSYHERTVEKAATKAATEAACWRERAAVQKVTLPGDHSVGWLIEYFLEPILPTNQLTPVRQPDEPLWAASVKLQDCLMEWRHHNGTLPTPPSHPSLIVQRCWDGTLGPRWFAEGDGMWRRGCPTSKEHRAHVIKLHCQAAKTAADAATGTRADYEAQMHLADCVRRKGR